MENITNEQKFKTPDERVRAFKEFCDGREGCTNCVLRDKPVWSGSCPFHWLALPYEEEKPEPCYECGGEMVGEKGMWKGKDVCYLRCAKCGCSTGSHNDFQSATIKHNLVCRAVEAAKKGEAK